MGNKEIDERIKKNDYAFFENLYYQGEYDKEIFERNEGDGNDYELVFTLKGFPYPILLEGTYSSWDSSHFHSVSYAEEFEFVETRFQPMSKAKLRDLIINDILNDETK